MAIKEITPIPPMIPRINLSFDGICIELIYLLLNDFKNYFFFGSDFITFTSSFKDLGSKTITVSITVLEMPLLLLNVFSVSEYFKFFEFDGY